MKKTYKKDIQTLMFYLRSKGQSFIALFLFSAFFLFSPFVYSKKVGRISIQGNKLIEKSLIQSHIQMKEGLPYSAQKAKKDVRKLFSLGFFDDIQVHVHSGKKGLNVLYRLKERIPIAEVEFKGNSHIQTEDLKELSLIKEHDFLNWGDLQKTFSAIREKYREQGYYTVEVSYKTQKKSKTNKFKLLIEIKENKKLFIKKISLIGNRNISSKEIKAFLQSKEWNILSFLGSSGVFKPEAIERDMQFIEYYYRNKGYLNVRVKKPGIRITPDKSHLYISFSITEGPRFKIGQALFKGDEIVPAKSLRGLLSLDKKEYFSLSRMQKDIQLISNFYKNKGYAFALVRPLFYPDRGEEDKIHVHFEVQPGALYKVRKIQIVGNHNARDKVILRRLHLREGDLYNESKKELSRQLIQQLGYFEEVKFKLSRKNTNSKELDILINIKERENTGEAHLAGGFNTPKKLFVQGGLKKQNFLGLDQSVAVNLNFNKYEEIFTFSYQAPYFLDSHWNFAFDLFNVAQDTLSGLGSVSASSINSLFSSREYSPYSRLDTGFSISLGRHLTEYSTVFLKYKLQNQNLSYDSIYFFRELPILSSVFEFLFGSERKSSGKKTSDQELSKLGDTFQEWNKLSYPRFKDVYNLEDGKGLNSSLSLIWEYDKRNDRYYASSGFWTRLSAEYSGLGGDFDYTKLRGKFHHYHSPFWKLVVKNRLDYGLVFSNKKGKKPPFSELFLLGGPYNLRGFEINTQGPRKFSQEGLEYAQNYNRLLSKAKSELRQKKAQLSALQNGVSTGQNQAKIESLKEEIITYENISSSNRIEFPDTFANRVYGGSQMFFYSLELEIPILESSGLRGAVFFDIGEANDKLLFDLKGYMRTDVGVGIRWKSPFGPISLDWAFPYNPRKSFGEESMNFEFSFGSQF